MSGSIPMGGKKCEPYDANDVALENGGMWAIHTNGDARWMRKLVFRGFLHKLISDDVHFVSLSSLAVRNSISRSLASFFPPSEGATLSSRS